MGMGRAGSIGGVGSVIIMAAIVAVSLFLLKKRSKN